MFVARSLATKSVARATSNSARFFSATTRTQYLVPSNEQQAAAIQKQSPNRAETWAKSQKPRSEALQGVRTLQRNLEQQPQPYAAINLISKTPIIYLHDNIAVCDGGKGVQGHPKIYINLDKPKAHVCQYYFPGCLFIQFPSVDAAQDFTQAHETVALPGVDGSARVHPRYYRTIPVDQNVSLVSLSGLNDIGENPTALLLLRHVPAEVSERTLFDATHSMAPDRAAPTRVLLIRRKDPVFNFSAGLAFVEFRSVEAAAKMISTVEGAGARRRAISGTVLDGVRFSFTSLGAFEIAGYPYHYSFRSSGGVRLQYLNNEYYVSEYPVPAGGVDDTESDELRLEEEPANETTTSDATPDQKSSSFAAAIMNPLIQEQQGSHKRKSGSDPVLTSMQKKLKQWQTKHDELLEEVRQKKREAATTTMAAAADSSTAVAVSSSSISASMTATTANPINELTTNKSYGDYDRLNCYLCYRHFESSEKLSNHERLSDMHRMNLSDLNLVARANRINAGLASTAPKKERL